MDSKEALPNISIASTTVVTAELSSKLRNLLEELKTEWNLALTHRRNSDQIIKEIHEQGKADGLPLSSIRALIVETLREVKKIGDRQIRRLPPEELRRAYNIASVNSDIMSEYQDPSMQLILGDFRGSDITDGSIDSIITDPPYAQEFLYLYEDLGVFASRVLKPGGCLFAIAPAYPKGRYVAKECLRAQTQLIDFPELALVHTGPTQYMHGFKTICQYKPVFFFVKAGGEERSPLQYMSNVFYSEKPEKSTHDWAQHPKDAGYLILHTTTKNQVICDPMMGNGAFGVAAKVLERQFIGVEIDPEHYKNAQKNIATYEPVGDEFERWFSPLPTKELLEVPA